MATQAASSSASYTLRPDSFSGGESRLSILPRQVNVNGRSLSGRRTSRQADEPEALAQYRISHPDKLLKYASKALSDTGRLPNHFETIAPTTPAVPIAADDETPEQASARLIKEKEAAAIKSLEEDAADVAEDKAYKEDLARLELLRVKRQIAKNLAQERKAQAEAARYKQEMLDTVARTEQVRAQVKEHYALLEKMKRDKEAKMKAAELVDKIKAKKLSKSELQAKIDTLRTSIDSHNLVKERLATVARERHAKFAEASRLIDEARALELPALTPPGEVAEVEPVEAEPKARASDSRDRDRPGVSGSSGSVSKLTPTTLPFTPSTATSSSRAAHGSSSQPSSRGGTPAPRSVPTGPSGAGSVSASGSASGSGAPSRPSHLPSRPSAPAAVSSTGGNARPATLPARPTTLRTVTGPSGASSTAAVEEGELPDERRSTDVRGTGAVSMRQQPEAKDTAGSGTRGGGGGGDRAREAGTGGRGVKRGAGNEPDRGGRPLTRGRR